MNLPYNRTSILAGLALVAPIFANHANASEDFTLDSITLTGDKESSQTEVVFTLSKDAEGHAISSYELNDPLRLVFDIADTSISPQFVQGEQVGLVSNVKVELIEDEGNKITRITLVLRDTVQNQFVTTGNKIRVTLSPIEKVEDPLAEQLENGGEEQAVSNDPLADELANAEANDAAPEETTTTATANTTPTTSDPNAPSSFQPEYKVSGPEALPTGASLTSLDFDQQENVSRVLIGVKNVTTYSDRKQGSKTILIDMPGAFVPQSLTRVLNTSKFYSPVKLVQAHRTSKGALIKIVLRQQAEYEIKRSANDFIIIDIPVPEEMRQEKAQATQSATSISPDGPDGSISNAYQKEILIGQQGNTVDPQAAFGSGGGSGPAGQFGMATGFMYDSTSATTSQFSGKRMSLDFVNADIHSIFRLISHVSGLNIVTGDNIAGKITVRLEDVPWDQALAAILQAKGLGSQRFGNIIRVAPIDQIKVEQQAALETKRAQEELIDLQLLVIPLDYAQASELQSQVTALLSSRGSLQVDTRGNQFIIKDTEQKLAQIRELIRHLDKSTPQVLIEARIVEASSQYSKNLGIQWGANIHANPSTGYSTGLFFPNSVGISGGRGSAAGAATFYSPTADIGENLMVDLGADASTSAVAVSLGSIPGLIDIDARLSAMESDGWGKVVSEPRITTMDNKEARISQGARVPYLSTSSGGTQVQFVMAALEMSVTPHITSSDQISLSITISNNRPDFANLVQGQPAIQIKEAQTSVLVADGDTTVIGGVFASESSNSKDYVPGFSKIPLLGYLFQSHSENLTRNEMLVFITPHIVTREKAK